MLTARDKAKSRQKAQIFHRRNLVRAQICNWCETAMADEMHHPDYTAPLNVLFLCRECHLIHHAAEAERKIAA